MQSGVGGFQPWGVAAPPPAGLAGLAGLGGVTVLGGYVASSSTQTLNPPDIHDATQLTSQASAALEATQGQILSQSPKDATSGR